MRRGMHKCIPYNCYPSRRERIYPFRCGRSKPSRQHPIVILSAAKNLTADFTRILHFVQDDKKARDDVGILPYDYYTNYVWTEFVFLKYFIFILSYRHLYGKPKFIFFIPVLPYTTTSCGVHFWADTSRFF